MNVLGAPIATHAAVDGFKTGLYYQTSEVIGRQLMFDLSFRYGIRMDAGSILRIALQEQLGLGMP